MRGGERLSVGMGTILPMGVGTGYHGSWFFFFWQGGGAKLTSSYMCMTTKVWGGAVSIMEAYLSALISTKFPNRTLDEEALFGDHRHDSKPVWPAIYVYTHIVQSHDLN